MPLTARFAGCEVNGRSPHPPKYNTTPFNLLNRQWILACARMTEEFGDAASVTP
jgi:hypothetical protein